MAGAARRRPREWTNDEDRDSARERLTDARASVAAGGRRVRRRHRRRRDGRRRRRARAGAARGVGRAGREGRLRLGDDLPVFEADPRRPALPGAVRLRAGARIAPRARDAPAPGPASGAAAAVPGADLPRFVAEPDQGSHRPEALRLAHARTQARALSTACCQGSPTAPSITRLATTG